MSFATITMKGRLGRDPELKQVGQNQVCKLAVATSERWNDQSGQRQEKTTWHNVEFWGKQAENVAKFFKKGDEIFVMGDVTSDEWTDQQGQKRTAQKVKGFKFDFVGGASQQAQPQPNAYAQAALNTAQNVVQNTPVGQAINQQFANGQPVPPAYQNNPQFAPNNPNQQQPNFPQGVPQPSAIDNDTPF
mgnify:FL=1